MIDLKSLEKEHINKISKVGNKKLDSKLMEKMIRAFYLLERLVEHKLEFTFKGGTSLILISSELKRLSIDIDIISSVVKAELEQIFPYIIQSGVFISWEEDVRPKQMSTRIAHYKFFYKSQFDSKFGIEPIILDVLFEAMPYPETRTIKIEHPFLISTGEYLEVRVPSIESVLGDKLTAFAPKTTGILYSKKRPIEVIKQLFDIAFLFDIAIDLQTIKSSYLTVVMEEINYRQLNIFWRDVIADTLNACETITFRDAQNPNFVMLSRGISNIKNFMVSPFSIDEAIVCASKTAYLCSLLLNKDFTEIEKYKKSTNINNYLITNYAYTKFNKLKKANAEAFFYWFKALDNLDKALQ
ncbi:MAG: nucleotidyl transferase AbiEii/AbiGii toxin family protein [Bacteroidales bacterium]|nr:nucleotidyl transferase AbiEii/AbiGii toxin family protein [Bacteroidales bacterium]